MKKAPADASAGAARRPQPSGAIGDIVWLEQLVGLRYVLVDSVDEEREAVEHGDLVVVARPARNFAQNDAEPLELDSRDVELVERVQGLPRPLRSLGDPPPERLPSIYATPSTSLRGATTQ